MLLLALQIRLARSLVRFIHPALLQLFRSLRQVVRFEQRSDRCQTSFEVNRQLNVTGQYGLLDLQKVVLGQRVESGLDASIRIYSEEDDDEAFVHRQSSNLGYAAAFDNVERAVVEPAEL